jgi:hypothetical protein
MSGEKKDQKSNQQGEVKQEVKKESQFFRAPLGSLSSPSLSPRNDSGRLTSIFGGTSPSLVINRSPRPSFSPKIPGTNVPIEQMVKKEQKKPRDFKPKMPFEKRPFVNNNNNNRPQSGGVVTFGGRQTPSEVGSILSNVNTNNNNANQNFEEMEQMMDMEFYGEEKKQKRSKNFERFVRDLNFIIITTRYLKWGGCY